LHSTELIQKVCSAKERELKLGADGFLTYDASFVPYLKQLWNPDNVKNTSEDDKSSAADRILTSKDLLQVIPQFPNIFLLRTSVITMN